jgi:uncharacterized membrane protein YcaP (DUF421 family)
VILGILEQAAAAVAYYAGLVVLMRLAGKRLAGQVTSFDLLVLITLGVVLQTTALMPGKLNAAVFVVTVFASHRGLAWVCARSTKVRHLLRGEPRPLIRDGVIDERVLRSEGMTHDDLLAGLRKLGISDPKDVAVAVLEETGHVSAIEKEAPAS